MHGLSRDRQGAGRVFAIGRIPAARRQTFLTVAAAMPDVYGARISVSTRPELLVSGGKLARHGQPVHAACFLRRRELILETGLFDDPGELRRVLAHELFHFVWLRLGNPRRRGWTELLAGEHTQQVAGELGWSAEMRRNLLTPRDFRNLTPRCRLYICESFCDTGAWIVTRGRHPEYTLPHRYRRIRARWFQELLSKPLAV